MKTLQAGFVIINEDTEEYLDEPYYTLRGGKWVKEEDVFGADRRDGDGIIEAAFQAGRNGTGDLVCLNCGDGSAWLTTTDKINSGPLS